jgi:hypothetical protein
MLNYRYPRLPNMLEAKRLLGALGVSLTRANDEYRVSIGREESAAYETDILAAIGTGRAMAKHVRPSCKHCDTPIHLVSLPLCAVCRIECGL